jgi:nucleotide-binding universal stress UspA family protein
VVRDELPQEHACAASADPRRVSAGGTADDLVPTTGRHDRKVPAMARTIFEPAEVVVLTAAEPPAWLERWCRATGRHLRAAPVLSGGLGAGRTHPAELAASNARLGSAVLLHRTPPPSVGSQRVAIGVKNLPDDENAVIAAAQCASATQADLIILHAVPTSFAERSVGLDAALDRGHALLAHARRVARRAAPAVSVAIHLMRALPHEIVGENLHADLLVLGGHRPATEGTLGLVALSALHHAPCSVLLVTRGSARR